ncbi:MAG: DNA mismatch repair endonuclease MutL, partial [Duncaniella sp.]|nr:DNA mismatch repair endonuclease MutL [Duncaniella sp.]
VELRTMLRGSEIGTRIVINGSKVESQNPEVMVEGTNMMVKNLFFNTPARRKFLRKDAVELAAIMREFERLALVNTGVEFTLISNDVTIHSLRRGSLKQRIVELFGKNLDKTIIPVETDTTIVRLNGFIGLPANARKRNALQYLMVNGRNMRHPVFRKAILECYEHLIPADAEPNYFIALTVDPETIDVNIHPTKSEIKFENESAIRQILVAAVRDSLGRYNAAPAIEFDLLDAPDIPVFKPDSAATHDVEIDSGYNPFSTNPSGYNPAQSTAWNPFESDSTGSPRASRPSKFNDWEKLYDDFVRKRDEGLADAAATVPAEDVARRESEGILDGISDDPSIPGTVSAAIQLRSGHILTPSRGGVMLIDQHRAHYRVLYDSFISSARNHSFVAQHSMFPDTLTLSASQHAVLASIAGELAEYGFELSNPETTTWSIDASPSVLDSTSPRDILLDIIDSVVETGEAIGEQLGERLARAMARSRAIRRNVMLSADEMDRIISDLLRLQSPGLTPEGKTVFTIIPTDTLTGLLK